MGVELDTGLGEVQVNRWLVGLMLTVSCSGQGPDAVVEPDERPESQGFRPSQEAAPGEPGAVGEEPAELPVGTPPPRQCSESPDQVDAVIAMVASGAPAVVGDLVQVSEVRVDRAMGLEYRAADFSHAVALTAESSSMLVDDTLTVALDPVLSMPEIGGSYLLVAGEYLEGHLFLRVPPLCTDEAVRVRALAAAEVR